MLGMRFTARSLITSTLLLFGALSVLPAAGGAQDRLKTMPGDEQYRKMSGLLAGAMISGTVPVAWIDSGTAFEYQRDGKSYRYDVAAGRAVAVAESAQVDARQQSARGTRGFAAPPARGRQIASAVSPDGAQKLVYRDRNLWLSAADGSGEIALTTDGSEKTRIKYGTASWVYGEELNQATAFWWSPSAKRLAYYRFDESGVPDYYLALDSLMELLRHPDIFAAASSSSPPTDWRNYDTIYTERYMWIPQESRQGYDAGSAMTYADSLRGRLMLYYGTADNNVHPSNMMQLISALQRAGKSFDLQLGPDRGHSGINVDRMMEFFIENLVLNPPHPASAF